MGPAISAIQEDMRQKIYATEKYMRQRNICDNEIYAGEKYMWHNVPCSFSGKRSLIMHKKFLGERLTTPILALICGSEIYATEASTTPKYRRKRFQRYAYDPNQIDRSRDMGTAISAIQEERNMRQEKYVAQ